MRLVATRLTKTFAGVRALEEVGFDLVGGEIHALVGENGAGKSTLVKILAGAVRPDAGEVTLDGTRLPGGDPLAVRRSGVSLVYQELSLVPSLSVADNVCLGREIGRVWLDRAGARRHVRARLAALGVDLDPDAPVESLNLAHRQLVEIARALSGDARVLMLDEPTASVSGVEADRLFALLRRLRSEGLGIVLVSHRLDEVLAVADRVTVLRDGRRVASAPAREVDRLQLIRWMVGRELRDEFPLRPPATGPRPVVLEVRGLAAPPALRDATFSVRAGEILGLAGLVGAGRSTAGLALVGARRASGEIRLDGQPLRVRSPADAIARGLVYVTEDRQARGLWPHLSAEANLTLTSLGRFTRAGFVRRARERAAAAEAARRVDLRAASLAQPATTLSGGNQQKILLARYLLEPRRVVVLDEPTRGVDVGARAEIYALVARLAAEGSAVVLISSDLTEVLGLADRIVVMRDGRTVGELSREDATPERVMALAATGRAA